jgi:hypothetical protein
LVFYKKSFPALRKKHKDMDVTDIAKRIGQNWKELSAEERAKYAVEAQQLRADGKKNSMQ